MKDWRKDLLYMLGAKPTKQNLRFLSTWQRWEGGHTHNKATWNWLNTTQNAPGATGSINSVGVKAFKDYQSGINAIAVTLLNGKYNDIVHSLRAGNPYKVRPTAGLETWVSGRPDGNPDYAQRVLGGSGAPKAPYQSGGGGARGNLALAPDRPGKLNPLMEMAWAGDNAFLDLMRSVAKGVAVPFTKSGVRQGKVQGGITLPLEWQGTHVTDNLGWGTKTAEDIMGAPGTGVIAPLAGTVVYFHPTGAQGGGSMLLRLENGREMWLGHIADGLKAGTRFKAGQRLASISPDHPRPHVHIDMR